MKKSFVYITVIAILLASMSLLSAGSTNAGPNLSLLPQLTPQTVQGPVIFKAITKVGVGKCDSMTSTTTAMKMFVFTAPATTGISSVYFAVTYAASGNVTTPTAFTSRTTYWVIANTASGTTVSANACTVLNGSGNSCTVFSDPPGAVVSGIAIGY